MQDLFAVMGEYRRAVAELVLDRWFPQGVLILGCGDLTFKPLAGSRVIRFDTDRWATDLSILGDGEHLPFKDSSLSAVIAMEVIEHVKKPYKLLEEIDRVLTPGGVLLLTTPNAAHLLSRVAMLFGAFIPDRTLHEDSIDHLHFFDARYLKRALTSRFSLVASFHRFITLPHYFFISNGPVCWLFRNSCMQLVYTAQKEGGVLWDASGSASPSPS
jgi:SAM-dependent methyltransferase